MDMLSFVGSRTVLLPRIRADQVSRLETDPAKNGQSGDICQSNTDSYNLHLSKLFFHCRLISSSGSYRVR
jgi:hypothetical protein